MSTISHDDRLVTTKLPFENGDHLEQEEFLARWEQYPEIRHAELINGVVYMNAAATRSVQHGIPHSLFGFLISSYSFKTSGTISASGCTTKLDRLNVLEPDLFLGIEEKYGGQCRIDSAGYIASAPELVVEIAASSVSRDLHIKKAVYAQFGVQEYIVWRTEDHAIDYFRLTDKNYELVAIVQNMIKSKVFPGLWLDVESLLNNQATQALAMLHAGLASVEYQEFREALGLRKQS